MYVGNMFVDMYACASHYLYACVFPPDAHLVEKVPAGRCTNVQTTHVLKIAIVVHAKR